MGDEMEKTGMAEQHDGLPDLYANSTRVAASGYDLTLRFVLQRPQGDGGTNSSRIVADVHLAHGQAWAMAHLVLKALETVVKTEKSAFLVPNDVLERLELTDEFSNFVSNALSES